MHYIARSLRSLKSALPDSSLHYEPAHVDSAAQLRAQACGVMGQLGWLFSRCPKITEIALSPRFSEGADEMVDPINLDLAMTIQPEAPGARPIVLCYQSDRDPHARAAAAQKLCTALGEKLDLSGIVSAFKGDTHRFWQEGAFMLTREAYAKTFNRGALDFDGLYARRHGEGDFVAQQQAELGRAPAYWNRATVVGIPDRVEAGMDVHACDANGVSALVAATIFADDWAVTTLCRAGAVPDFVDGTGHSAVSAAIAAKNWPGFRDLIKAGGNPDGPKLMPTLLVAFETGPAATGVEVIIEAGGDVARVMPDGLPFNSPLERFQPKFVREQREWEWGKLVEPVLARSTEAALAGALQGVGSRSNNRLSKSGPAL